MMTSQRITGGLLYILRFARRAWYHGPDGITAYYEQPDQAVPGAVYVNGKRICTLKVDDEGLYWDTPSPRVQDIIRQAGVRLEAGWTCEVEQRGSALEAALAASSERTAFHQPSGLLVREVPGEPYLHLWLDTSELRWRVLHSYLRQAVSELGASPDAGWFPEQAQYRLDYNRRRERS